MKATLTDRQHREIRFKYAAGHATQATLAKEYGVGQSHICRITLPDGLNRKREWNLKYCKSEKGKTKARAWRATNKGNASNRLAVINCIARKLGHAEISCSREELENLIATTEGCSICGARPGGGRDNKHPTLLVDHCHNTGVLRGLLCGQCNSMLGFAGDSPAMLRDAANYIERADQ